MLAKYLIPWCSVLIVCCRESPTYPEGGYAYPKNISAKDTNFYIYQLRDSMKPLDKWRDDYSFIFYRAFNEPNLSIQPQPKETFRFLLGEALGNHTLITFNKDSLTIKKGNPTELYEQDTTRLSAIENLHLRILNRRFPIDTTGKKPYVKHYLDSMVKLYPQLLDPAYYHKIYDKQMVATGKLFTPEVTKFAITRQQYTSIVQEINASGFWALPWEIDCETHMMDGYSFHLEANTRTRYKYVNVMGCPNDSSAITKVCQKIIELAKLDKKLNLIWDYKIDTVNVPDIKLEPIK